MRPGAAKVFKGSGRCKTGKLEALSMGVDPRGLKRREELLAFDLHLDSMVFLRIGSCVDDLWGTFGESQWAIPG